MERIAREFFSMRMMVVALFVFLVSIGLATFVETVYDTQTAKMVIYNAKWFMILLLYLCAGMIANIFKYRMFRPEKISILTFHLAFIVMILGAAVTRFYGFEGMMLIREGETVGHMYSADPYFTVVVSDDKHQTEWELLAFMSEGFDNDFSEDIPLKDKSGNVKKDIRVDFVDYRKNLVDSLVQNDSIKETALGFVTSGMTPEFVEEGGFLMLGDVALSYQKDDAMPGVHVWKEGNKFKMKSVMGLRSMSMSKMRTIGQNASEVPDSMYNVIMPDSVITLETATLYNVQGQQFVLKEIKKNARKVLLKSPVKDSGLDYLYVQLFSGDKKSDVIPIPGGIGRIADQTAVNLRWEGVNFRLAYGCKMIEMPFKVKCRDFQLDRYPGSSSPSSFASELTIIDEVNDKKFDKRLFMNHVIDYGGYRLFQSGYDSDEGGTHLSVNFDWWGTNISYLGYLLMGLGMVLAMFAPAGRMRDLFKKVKTVGEKREALKTLALVLSMSVASAAFAQNEVATQDPVPPATEDHSGHDHANHDHATHEHSAEAAPSSAPEPPKKGKLYIMTKEHSEELSTLLVQSEKHSRYMPFHTMCEQLLRKIHRSNTYKDYNSVQTIMSMHMYPEYWGHEKLIYVSSKGEIRESLGVDKYASFLDLIDWESGNFKLMEEYNEAFQTMESKRNERQKQVIKLGEKLEIMTNILSRDWNYIRIIPIKSDTTTHNWSTILNFDVESEEFVTAVRYFGALNDACMGKGGYGAASDNLAKLKAMQRKLSNDELPSETVVNMEVTYNKMEVVKQSYRAYMIIGVFALIFFLIGLLIKGGRPPRFIRIAERIIFWLAVLTTIYLGSGLVIRALISGHVPWSDGYEALLYISCVTVIAGILMYRLNKVILAAACLLAFFLLFVSSLNILDPEITSLQPVLKSYWLKIHVAIITASYAPLGIGAVLGLINLMLFIARNKSNYERLGLTIKQLTYITEIVITIGVIMLTIGTFLGGIWANESWGRYWGWDPKETWALVAILAYAVILHLRFIPGVKDNFTFSAVSFWGYSTILFTFFGVNFYLVGLHSYANGEGLAEFPTWLVGLGIGLYLFTEFAAFRNQMFKAKGAGIPKSYFTKKLLILIVMTVAIALMMIIFKISPVSTILLNTAIIIGLIVLATGIQFAWGNLGKNKSNKETLNA